MIDDSGDAYYAPWRVRALLARYPTLLDLRPQHDAALGADRPKRSHPSLWWEGQACQRADIASALLSLPWFTQRALVATVVYERDDRATAEALGCERETVRRHRIDGLCVMATHLGYPPDLATGWARRQLRTRKERALIWRKDGEADVDGLGETARANGAGRSD